MNNKRYPSFLELGIAPDDWEVEASDLPDGGGEIKVEFFNPLANDLVNASAEYQGVSFDDYMKNLIFSKSES